MATLALLAAFAAVAAMVPISGAIMGPGQVTVEGEYKTVQSLDGGIVAEIRVRNGDRVSAGDLLVRLDTTAAAANLAVLDQRLADALIQKARLEAEIAAAPELALPASLPVAASEPAMAALIKTQRALLAARLAVREGNRRAIAERLHQLEEAQRGLATQLEARRRETALIAAEIEVIKPLFDQGYASRQRLIPLQREEVRLAGEIDRLQSELVRAGASIAETRQRGLTQEAEVLQASTDELRRVEALVAELRESRIATADRLARTDLRAPAAGRVHALRAHTVGGVIKPGEPILQVIPDGAPLAIAVRLSPTDADKVHAGSAAMVRFPSFDAATVPRLTGRVRAVSAAEHTDQQGRSYFTAEIVIDASELRQLPQHNTLIPGMPAEVYVETGMRTIASYLLKPLAVAIGRTFRER